MSKREIAQPKDFTPEFVVQEITEQIMGNPFIVRYDYERTVRPDESPTITITLELLVSKNSEVDRLKMLEEVQKNLDRLKRI